MSLSCQRVPVGNIRFTDAWNLHPWEFRRISADLHQSFSEHGLLHPPIVLEEDRDAYTLIAGARRLAFLKEDLSPAEVACMVVSRNTERKLILHIVLADQISTGHLSLAEKARFVEIAGRSLSPEEIASAFERQLQLKNSPVIIPKLVKLLQQDKEIIREVHAGRLQDRMVWELLALPDQSDRSALVQFFKTLGMGGGKQRRFFTLLRDIAFREDISIKACLQKCAIAEILDHRELTVSQKIDHLGRLLQQQLNPSSTLAEEQFTKVVNSWKLPDNYTVRHAPFFEKDSVTLSISFDNLSDCERYLKQQKKRETR